jgi:rubrerythrin
MEMRSPFVPRRRGATQLPENPELPPSYTLRLSEFRCAHCSYGARCTVAPLRCPMCSGTKWTAVADHGHGRRLGTL